MTNEVKKQKMEAISGAIQMIFDPMKFIVIRQRGCLIFGVSLKTQRQLTLPAARAKWRRGREMARVLAPALPAVAPNDEETRQWTMASRGLGCALGLI
ncbi:hypothetical protein LOAG_09868 [Loa loa]|uniref:Uncharacterized protein n=1 Tax=Loa loa TaxID=7209 RepID=A0A1S0TQW5_LOALO|nr:hypothetical protein LOAG_09868 [Loa loa]EFO18625.1 hypothetical protein LOAG_09868 [Loa loa]